MERAQAVVDRAPEQKALYEAEVVEGEARYAKRRRGCCRCSSSCLSKVTELQERINALVLERDRSACSPSDP